MDITSKVEKLLSEILSDKYGCDVRVTFQKEEQE